MILGVRDATMRELARDRQADATGGGAPPQGGAGREGGLWVLKPAISGAAVTSSCQTSTSLTVPS